MLIGDKAQSSCSCSALSARFWLFQYLKQSLYIHVGKYFSDTLLFLSLEYFFCPST